MWNERRLHRRRPLQVPVFWSPAGAAGFRAGFCGKTVDVCTSGLSICSANTETVNPGSLVNVLIFDSEKKENIPVKAPLTVRAQVCWVNSSEQVFGIRYLT